MPARRYAPAADGFRTFQGRPRGRILPAKAEATRQTSDRYDEIVRGAEEFRHTMDSILRRTPQERKRMNEHLKKYGNGD